MPDAAAVRMVHGGYELITNVAELAAVSRMLSAPQGGRLKRLEWPGGRQQSPRTSFRVAIATSERW